jgi:hypothetical protein
MRVSIIRQRGIRVTNVRTSSGAGDAVPTANGLGLKIPVPDEELADEPAQNLPCYLANPKISPLSHREEFNHFVWVNRNEIEAYLLIYT